ncbi:unnamed protein product, partial [Brachionus calyciflorus]
FLDDNVKKPSYWMPLDPDIYLPYHHKLNRVPCLFEPFQKDFKRNYKQSPEEKTPNKPFTKRKKKSKNKRANETTKQNLNNQ